MKKLLSIITVLALCLSMLPATALAAESGTDTPYAVTGGNIYFDEITGAITGCDESVTEAEIPSTINGVAVTSIGNSAFYYCNSLTSVTIPDSVTSIEYEAFSGCSSLTSVTIPDSVTSIGHKVFENCSSLTSVLIPDKVTSIEEQAFYGCNSLTDVSISTSVTSIDVTAFYGCSSLTGISVDPENPSYASEGGVLFDKQKSTVICYPGGKANFSYAIPDCVTSIGNSAFYHCGGLTRVTIPDGVTSIGDSAFSGCGRLASVTIPASVTSIDYYAFYGCINLADIYYAGSENQWKQITIKSANGMLTDANIHFNSTGPVYYTLTVTYGTGDGEYAEGAKVAITADAAPDGKVFDKWTTDDDGTFADASSATTTFTMPASDVTVTATYRDAATTPGQTYTVTITGSTGEKNYEAGETVTITATVPDGQQFTGWIVEEGNVKLDDPNSPETTFTMPAGNVKVTPTYKPLTYAVTVKNGTGSGDYEIGADVTITAIVPDGQQFAGWTVDEGGADFTVPNSSPATFKMPAHNVTVTAKYEAIATPPAQTYILTVTNGKGGGEYAAETKVTITADTAPAGKVFDKWTTSSGGTFENETSATTTFTMPASDVTVTATYRDAPTPPAQTYTLIVTGGTGGSKYAAGTRVSITAYAAPMGKVFDKWITSSGGTFENETSATTTFIMPANDVTVSATYKDASTTPGQTYTLTVTNGKGGGKYAAGAKVTITADTAPDGKVFDKWTTGNGGTFTDASSAATTFTMPANDVTVTATYKDASTTPDQTYTLTVTNGTADGKTSGKYAAGAKVTITANAAPEGKAFDKWTSSNGGTFTDASSAAATFTMPANDVTVTANYKDNATPPAPEQTAYVIYFDPSGGTVDITSMVTGTDGRLPNLPVPVYRGYIFSGWYTSPTGGSRISTNTVFDRNTTVYAHWDSESDISDDRSAQLTEYAVIAPPTTGGTVTVNRKYAAEGTTVTVTVAPDNGYEMTSLIARDSWWNELKLTYKGGGKYTLTMPNRAVTVNAAFAVPAAAQQPEPAAAAPVRIWPYPGFTDVSANAWYYDAVRFVCETGLMNGLSSTAFSPYDNLSRVQLTQILYNMAGNPPVNNISGFADVAPGNWYANAVAWAVSRNIIDGYDSGTFGPYDYVTREEIVVMLWRYAGKPVSEIELYFTDISNISTYTLPAVRWAVEKGILSGNSGGALTPKGLATRAQMAQMLKNYFHA